MHAKKYYEHWKSHHDLAWPCHQSEIAAHFEKCPIKLLTTFTIGKKTHREKSVRQVAIEY